MVLSTAADVSLPDVAGTLVLMPLHFVPVQAKSCCSQDNVTSEGRTCFSHPYVCHSAETVQ